jgi:hypothetical protein
MKKIFLIPVFLLTIVSTFFAQKSMLINNVQIFNGKDATIITGNVLISGNEIKKISTTPIATDKMAITPLLMVKENF